MKIKRFVAADMRSAMNLVRKEHGPDAVILSNRRIEEGIEIVAAANYDESAVQRALEASRRDVAPPPAPKPRTAADAVIAAVTRRRSNTPAPEPVAATTSAVAALARAAVGATGRTLDSADEIVPTRGSTGFAATLARAAVNEPALPEQIFAPFAEAIVAPAPAPAASAPANRARFQIDPPHEMHHESAAPAVQPPPLPGAAPTEAQPEIAASEPAVADAVIETSPEPTLAPAPVLTVVAQDDAEIRQLRQEVAGMRQVIEREMNRFTDERLRGCPVRATALDLMDEYGFDAGLARDVAMQIPLETEAHRGRGLMLGLISRKLPIAPVDPLEEGGVIALVGPTGAGKTTTIAKLASRFAEKHAPRDVALVTTDTTRIGAREQLYGYGRQLGIAVHEANSGTDLDQLLERLKDYKLVLIDTAGLGPRDRALAAQLQWLRAARQVRTLLVLPANTSFGDMDEVVRRFGAANLQGLVLSKLDETGRFGNALSVAVDHALPITWVTDGQDVPEDLHRASAANLVLRLEDLRRAADMPCNPELNHAVA
ncbi:flagellar biosynthesis protein FlhF [Stenotrophomonas sp. 22692]|jgi:flagellar biosynthetic protein FlhF|uniref:Flagellar biosynthesis protein FlhF n=1 Tax=Stenotrophomonas geniculata TaxID=86188 RepID=A0ABW1N7C1_9GAMM|nr:MULTISPECIES: flagellar biosynthesis protein FlhF [Stenotrophomonas]MCF3499097.1 flagellar biosynthesis protein FlhF [Stenotrophomonas maltophilia]KRG37837.1 flagellar biosynthesis protein FlhF [Stenotrophomonas geniculata ATCC 19374 = JCM 13324]MCI1053462.1 flagellar biosynthesis protein FlhF [Stenotrophomonas maltophilia]MCI1093051.1 flagellar biosynthesis protein FlhF [Stenotrophomonas maltophilia]MCI1130187.1 flagellar biosynthesis protein FlhF [Stenotrophomonas maltophilia]